MPKEGQPKCHEFWLRKYPDSPDDDPNERLDTYRVALGELIEARERQTYRPPDGSHSPDFWNKSGSIGFMNIAVRNELVPKEGATPYPNPNQSPHLEHVYPHDQCETTSALVVLVIGVEPPYRGDICYVTTLYKRVEELALEWRLNTIVVSQIENRGVKRILPKIGYALYNNGQNAVKRL